MPKWQDKATARKSFARVKNDLAALKSKQRRMYLFLTTLYIISAVAGESEITHKRTENQECLVSFRHSGQTGHISEENQTPAAAVLRRTRPVSHNYP